MRLAALGVRMHRTGAWVGSCGVQDYTLRSWLALACFIDDWQLPVDKNHIENQIRPIAVGRNNWRFADSLRTGNAQLL